MNIANVIAIARAEKGVTERTRHNDHPRIEMYLNKLAEPPGASSTIRIDRGMSWCAAYVLWCLWRAGYALRGNFWLQRRVANLVANARDYGAVLAIGEAIEPGDLVCWLGAGAHDDAGPSGHVAMVVETNNARTATVGVAGEVRTIGGNERLDDAREGVNERWLSALQRERVAAVIRPARMLKEAV